MGAGGTSSTITTGAGATYTHRCLAYTLLKGISVIPTNPIIQRFITFIPFQFRFLFLGLPTGTGARIVSIY
jgi:hypothetical protein